jgi:hypothetical protein
LKHIKEISVEIFDRNKQPPENLSEDEKILWKQQREEQVQIAEKELENYINQDHIKTGLNMVFNKPNDGQDISIKGPQAGKGLATAVFWNPHNTPTRAPHDHFRAGDEYHVNVDGVKEWRTDKPRTKEPMYAILI